MKKTFTLFSFLFFAFAIFSQTTTIVGDFDTVTPAYDGWGGVTASIDTPPVSSTGYALLVNTPANNGGVGFWISVPFIKNQYKQLKFKVQSTVAIQLYASFETASQTVTWGAGYSQHFEYTRTGQWQEFTIDLTDIATSGRIVILPDVYQGKPASSMYIDDLTFVNSTTTGLNDNNIGNQISIYPNPTSDLVNIKMSENEKWADIKLFTAEGKLVYNKYTINKTEQINLKRLNVTGLVYVNVTTATNNNGYKIIVK